MKLSGTARLLVSCVLLALAPNLVSAQGNLFNGYWATSNLTSIIEITPCDGSLCGEIVWLWDVSVAGRNKVDEKNPQSSRQNRSLIGLPIFSRFSKDGDIWKGRIYNPEDGRTYRASVTLRNRNLLRVRGCWGPFCLNQSWRRLSSISIPTENDLSTGK